MRLRYSWPLALGLGSLLIYLRHAFFGLESLGNWSLGLAMACQFLGYQRILSEEQPKGLIQGLEWSQWGWFLFALALPGQGPVLGSLGFIVLQCLIKAPLSALLSKASLERPWLILAAFFALVGCLPFASFSAYFQAFVPLMSVGDAVSSMQQKLFSGMGLWAAIVLLSVVYQSCALGYFYWSRVLPKAPAQAQAWAFAEFAMLSGLLLSAAFGLLRAPYSSLIRGWLALLGVVF